MSPLHLSSYQHKEENELFDLRSEKFNNLALFKNEDGLFKSTVGSNISQPKPSFHFSYINKELL